MWTVASDPPAKLRDAEPGVAAALLSTPWLPVAEHAVTAKSTRAALPPVRVMRNTLIRGERKRNGCQGWSTGAGERPDRYDRRCGSLACIREVDRHLSAGHNNDHVPRPRPVRRRYLVMSRTDVDPIPALRRLPGRDGGGARKRVAIRHAHEGVDGCRRRQSRARLVVSGDRPACGGHWWWCRMCPPRVMSRGATGRDSDRAHDRADGSPFCSSHEPHGPRTRPSWQWSTRRQTTWVSQPEGCRRTPVRLGQLPRGRADIPVLHVAGVSRGRASAGDRYLPNGLEGELHRPDAGDFATE